MKQYVWTDLTFQDCEWSTLTSVGTDAMNLSRSGTKMDDLMSVHPAIELSLWGLRKNRSVPSKCKVR